MTPTATMESRLTTCTEHRIEYPQILFSRTAGQEIWAGKCEKCSAEEKLLSQARQLAQENMAEVNRRAQAQMDQREAQIAKQTQKEIDAYLKDVRAEAMDRRSEWEADVRRRMWEQFILDAELEMTAEFLDQLKGGR
jgi:CRISPR/Cas system-associated endonuclease Cas1